MAVFDPVFCKMYLLYRSCPRRKSFSSIFCLFPSQNDCFLRPLEGTWRFSWFGVHSGRTPNWDYCKILIWGSVSFFVKRVIWQWAERYNCNIMSQILSFLTHLTSLPVGSISSSHSKISAICWCHFLVWVLIPIDGAAIDGDMLSIVLRTFLARSS